MVSSERVFSDPGVRTKDGEWFGEWELRKLLRNAKVNCCCINLIQNGLRWNAGDAGHG